VDDPFLTVAVDNLALLSLVVSSGDLNFVFLSEWDGPDVVLASELLGERCAHQLPSDVGRG